MTHIQQVWSPLQQLCVLMHKQASCIMHVSLGSFAGQGEQQGGGSICKDLRLHWPYASTVCSMKTVGITWPMRCKNCSGVDRSATDLSGSSTYAFSFLVSSSLGAICVHQRCHTSCQFTCPVRWSSSVSTEANAYCVCQVFPGHSVCLPWCVLKTTASHDMHEVPVMAP